jgi:serine/threonine protein kinase
MLDRNGNLKIIDFGLSNSLEGRDFLTTQCGSMAYVLP